MRILELLLLSSFWELHEMKDRQKKMKGLKESGKELQDAFKNIMEECTQMWTEKFEPDDAKSVLAL
jgi:hypothetical protein